MKGVDNTTAWIFATVLCIVLLLYIFYPALIAATHEEPTKKLVSVRSDKSLEGVKPIISIVIPAYNEEDRLEVMLQSAFNYLSQTKVVALEDLAKCYTDKKGGTQADPKLQQMVVEWILVNDGSTDRTTEVFRNFASSLPSKSSKNMIWKFISFPRNAGKGAAVQSGMLASTGEYRLMVDADGATDFQAGLEALTRSLRKTPSSGDLAVVFGSRAQLNLAEEAGAQRSLIRNFLTNMFHITVVFLVGTNEIRDTQCGFKLFRADAAQLLFSHLHLRRWAFDIEIVSLASRIYTIKEVWVPWHEVEGSKLHTSALNLVLVGITMLRDMLCVCLCYSLGIWKLRQSLPQQAKSSSRS